MIRKLAMYKILPANPIEIAVLFHKSYKICVKGEF